MAKLSGMRAAIARRMRDSLDSAAQLSFHADVNLDRVIELRRCLKGDGIAVSVEDVVIKCVSNVLKRHPALNATLSEGWFEQQDDHNIGVAIALEQGLVAPALSAVQRKPVDVISAERRDLAGRAKAGNVATTEMRAGTFTVSNLGLHRVRYFTPIINTPQVAILGIGGSFPVAVLREDGTLKQETHAGLSLTVDHRVIDGAPAAGFLDDLAAELELVCHEALFQVDGAQADVSEAGGV